MVVQDVGYDILTPVKARDQLPAMLNLVVNKNATSLPESFDLWIPLLSFSLFKGILTIHVAREELVD